MYPNHFDLPQLLRDADVLKLELFPLPPHFAAIRDEHVRMSYASVLAATLLANQRVSETEGRLFGMLLASLGLAGRQDAVWQQAASLNQVSLRDFLRMAKLHQLASCFLLDALVLCRLDGPLSQGQLQLLTEMAELLLPEDELLVLTFWAAKVLGLPFDAPLPDSCCIAVGNAMRSEKIQVDSFDVFSWGVSDRKANVFSVKTLLARVGDMLAEQQLILASLDVTQGEKRLVREARSPVAGCLHKVLLNTGDVMAASSTCAMLVPLPPSCTVWRAALAIPAPMAVAAEVAA